MLLIFDFYSVWLKARSHVSVAKLSGAKIAIELQLLPPSCSEATLHRALICFTEHTIKQTKYEAELRYATLKCE